MTDTDPANPYHDPAGLVAARGRTQGSRARQVPDYPCLCGSGKKYKKCCLKA